MKTHNLSLKFLTPFLLGALIASAQADVVKTNNTTALNVGGSWVGGAVPTSADLMIFDNTLDATPKSYAIGGNVSANGISFRDAQSAQTITATASSTLTLANGSPGIDMTSAATSDFTISCLLGLGTSGGQTFNVANSGRTLLINAVISGTGPLTKTGAGIFKSSNNGHTYSGGTVIAGGTLQLGVNNGLASGPVTVTNGGTLDLNGLGLTNKANYIIHIAGAGVANGGALVNNGGTISFALTNLVLDADATLGAVGRYDMRPLATGNPSVDLAGHTLTKVGANIFFLQELSSITDGNIVVKEGQLGLNGVPLTGNGLITVSNSSELRMFRTSTAVSSNMLTRPLRMEAPALLNYTAAQVANQVVGSAITLVGAVSNNVLTAANTLEFAGVISGSGGINKGGPGTLLLSGTSTYSGDTIVYAGKLGLGTAWSGSGAVTVKDGGSLEVRSATQNSTLNLNSLTNGSAVGPTTNTFNLGGFANPAVTVVNVTNALVLNGTTVVNLTGTSGLTSGTFKLFTYGSIEGAGGFQMGVATGGNATLATNGNSIEVTFTPVTLFWRGETNGVALADWANGVSTNWFNAQANSRVSYADGNGVVFDDSLSLTGTTNINLTASVLPSSVTVSNVTKVYTFSGSGKISGPAALTKTGAGTMNLGIANDYTGVTTISQGALQLGVLNAIPTNTVAITVSNSGTLDVNGFNQTVMGLNGNGRITNSSPTVAELRFGAGSAGTFSGVIADSGSGNLTLFKTGGGYQTLTGNNTFSGGTTMNGGSLFLGSNGALGSGPLSLSFTAQVASDSSTPRSFTNDLNFSGGSTKNIGDAVNNGVLTFSGTVGFNGTASGTRTVSFNSDVVFSGPVGNGPLIKSGAGKLTMDGVNTCDSTTISAGTLAGSGSFSGPVAINGSTLSPGTGIGTLTIASNLTLNGTSTTHMELNATSSTCDLVSGLAKVTYGGTLDVVNLSGTLTIGQSFQLFSTATNAGSFTATNLPALPGDRVWNWNPVNGTLSVVTPVATNPTNITFSVSGGSLNLTWPGDHLGWIAQSNSVTLADTNYWFDIAGSASVTNLSIPINASLTNVFYRLRSPN